MNRKEGEGMMGVEDLLNSFRSKAENAYIEMIANARKDGALGWEIKVERGEFGRPELDAHCKVAELLGRYRAFVEACKCLEASRAAGKEKE